MKNFILTIASILALGLIADSQILVCQEAVCSASINPGNGRRVVQFRRGEWIDTDIGWIASPDDGWVPHRANLAICDTDCHL
jgi:hypothetical protein